MNASVTDLAETRQHAHNLIDRMPLDQLAAMVTLIETMFPQALATVPYEDELISEEETRAVAASKEWLKHNPPIPNEKALAEFGLSAEDFDRMGVTLSRS
jgi:hypothetical protein